MKKLMRAIEQDNELQTIRAALTDVMLSGAGLSLAYQDEAALDHGDGLTARQRALMLKAGEFGYRVKLRELP